MAADEPKVNAGGGRTSLGGVAVTVGADAESTVVGAVRGRMGTPTDARASTSETKRTEVTGAICPRGGLIGRYWLERSYEGWSVEMGSRGVEHAHPLYFAFLGDDRFQYNSRTFA